MVLHEYAYQLERPYIQLPGEVLICLQYVQLLIQHLSEQPQDQPQSEVPRQFVVNQLPLCVFQSSILVKTTVSFFSLFSFRCNM